jgi:hypothetical protein
MIATDGIQTIANREPVEIPWPSGSGEVALLERRGSGFTVEILLDAGEVWLSAVTEQAHFVVRVPDDSVLDAFEHPAFYIALAGEDPGELFRSTPEQE